MPAFSSWLLENIEKFDGAIPLFERSSYKPFVVKAQDLATLPEGIYQYDARQFIHIYGTESEPLPGFQLNTREQSITRIPSSAVVAEMIDCPTDLTGEGVRVAVIDTGVVSKTPQFQHKPPEAHRVRGFTNRDFMGHGTHTCTLVGGNAYQTEYGILEGIAPGAQIVSIKAFNPVGVSATYYILKAMHKAVELGCHIINISSGGRQVDAVDELAEHQFMAAHPEQIFVCSAGNAGDEWGIATPAVSPAAITVGSLSMLDNDLSHFSSRGPQGEWYMENEDIYNEDLAIYGDDLLKPDCVAPGGGRSVRGERPIEVITSSMHGWFEGFYDGKYDGIGGAQGTSQSAPFVSGLIALLLEARVIKTAADFKRKLATRRKDINIGYGLPVLSRFI